MHSSATCGQNIRRILDPKITGRIPANMVSLPQERFNSAFHLRRRGGIGQLNRDEIQCFAACATRRADDPTFRGGQGNEPDIVLAAPCCAEPLFVQHTDYAERNIANPESLANSCTPVE